MKKNRNAFFAESNMQASGFIPQPNMNINPNYMPYNASTQSSSFYSGPATMYPQTNEQNNLNTELDSRLSRIERQLNRLESRINKLESSASTTYNIKDADINPNSNMYMI